MAGGAAEAADATSAVANAVTTPRINNLLNVFSL
jgi:hypothetical protein